MISCLDCRPPAKIKDLEHPFSSLAKSAEEAGFRALASEDQVELSLPAQGLDLFQSFVDFDDADFVSEACPATLGLGLFGGVGMVFQVDGLTYTPASTSAFLTQTYCILVPLYHAVVARRFPRPVQVVATIGVIAGIVILSKIDWAQFRMGRGELETLLSTVFFTVQILVLDAPQFFRNRTKMVSSMMFITTGLVFAIVSILSNLSFDSYKVAAGIGQQFYLIAILVIFCTLLAFNLMNRCQKYIPASEAALIYTLEPVSTSLFATFLPICLSALVGVEYDNERLSMSLLIGGGLILFANLVMQIWGHTPVPHAGETPAPTTPHPGDASS